MADTMESKWESETPEYGGCPDCLRLWYGSKWTCTFIRGRRDESEEVVSKACG